MRASHSESSKAVFMLITPLHQKMSIRNLRGHTVSIFWELSQFERNNGTDREI